jgi:C1A family cysteine protease
MRKLFCHQALIATLVVLAVAAASGCTTDNLSGQAYSAYSSPAAAAFSPESNRMTRTGPDIDFSQDGSAPAGISAPVYALSIDANIALNGNAAYARIILVDEAGGEYLIYEASPLLSSGMSFSVSNVCEETCYLNGVKPKLIKTEMENARVDITSMYYSPVRTAERNKLSKRSSQESAKIAKMNENIAKMGLHWTAGKTSVSGLSYAEKKKLFPGSARLPNLQGFEYYRGGVFSLGGGSAAAGVQSDNLPPKWDWRDVNGENWMTRVKSQGGYTCIHFATIGTLEAQINLYYNQHLDLDLSEQMHADCFNNGDITGLSNMPPECTVSPNNCNPGNIFCKMMYYGVADEACDPFAGRDMMFDPGTCGDTSKVCSACNTNYVCSDWRDRQWKVSGFWDYKFPGSVQSQSCLRQTVNPSVTEFKKALIEFGPMSSGIKSMNHAMVLVGYNRTTLGGEIIWIFKNSWGEGWNELGWGVNGYAYIGTYDLSPLEYGSIPLGPYIPPTSRSYWPSGFTNTINCVDRDGDGYCSWGITRNRPDSCPSTCRAEKDCDDTRSDLGTFDQSMNCVPIATTGIVDREPLTPRTPTTGTLYIISRPAGATIYLDGVMKGNAPKRITDVSPGKHKIKAEKTGYISMTVEVTVLPGKTHNVPMIMLKKFW